MRRMDEVGMYVYIYMTNVRAKSKLAERELRPDRLRRAVASVVAVRLAVKGLLGAGRRPGY